MTNILSKCRKGLRRFRNAFRSFWWFLIGNKYARRSYSHNGEDMVLRAVFARYPSTYPGFYIDIGAHHPMRFSNARFFYENGWNGLCVDPLPGCSKLYSRQRPRDMFIEAGVAEEEGEMTYFMFAEPALNTFSEKIGQENAARVKARKKVKVYPLRRILVDYLPPVRKIDFLLMDVLR